MYGNKLLKIALPFAALSVPLAMVACDSGSGTNETGDKNPTTVPAEFSSDSVGDDSHYAIKYNVEVVEDLPNCTESRDGYLAVVLNEDALYQCSAER